MNKFIETHCHLDYLKAFPQDEILSMTKEAGVDKIVTISVEPDNFDAVLELANTHEHIYCTQGVHPHDAKKCEPKHLEIIKSRQKESKVVAVGEIGLDYHYDNSPREIQKEIFAKQLEIAVETNQPVVVHSREADDDTIEIISRYSKDLKRKGVIHSFTSTPRLAEFALSEGFYLGFNGIITFKNAEEVRNIVRLCPIDRILFETDSPFLSPTPHRGRENGPYRIPHIAEKICEIKEIAADELYPIVYQNSQNLFKI